MEDFYRIRRLPPYVFEQVNLAKAAARNAGADIIDLRSDSARAGWSELRTHGRFLPHPPPAALRVRASQPGQGGRAERRRRYHRPQIGFCPCRLVGAEDPWKIFTASAACRLTCSSKSTWPRRPRGTPAPISSTSDRILPVPVGRS